VNRPFSMRLRPTLEADLDFVLAAEQAPDNAEYINQWSRDRHRQACQHADERHWIVELPDAPYRGGYVILQHVQDANQCLHLKRIVITEKGKGLGRATLEQVLHTAFLNFDAHRVWLDVLDKNHRARSLYRSVGFVEEGKLRECFKTPTGFASMWLMGILRSEFLTRHGLAPGR